MTSPDSRDAPTTYTRAQHVEHGPARGSVRTAWFEATAAIVGLAVAATWVCASIAGSGKPAANAATLLVSVLVGVGAGCVFEVMSGNRWGPALAAMLTMSATVWGLEQVLLIRVAPLTLVAFAAGLVTWVLAGQGSPARRAIGVAAVCSAVVAGSATPVGAWTVGEPESNDPAVVRGNGIVVADDTHAFFLAQAVEILQNDGHDAVARFLRTADPNAPRRRDPRSGRRLPATESYLWRLQLGSHDADRVNKSLMPDHFFNWWTHSGKGLIAGPSAATYAEERFAEARRLWSRGDRSAAMYHLGAAAHLVADACTPPHASFLVPEHRAYENWILSNQASMKATSGGLYRDQFRVGSGHGGTEWSSDHTRGWVDQCAHRAAEYIPDAVQPPSEDPILNEAAAIRTTALIRDAQRITAGYLAFFFDEVGGP